MTKTIAHPLSVSQPNQEERVALERGDHLQFRPGIYVVRVIRGRAWMTHVQRDVTLKTGESVAMIIQHPGTVLSPLGRDPIELGISRIA